MHMTMSALSTQEDFLAHSTWSGCGDRERRNLDPARLAAAAADPDGALFRPSAHLVDPSVYHADGLDRP